MKTIRGLVLAVILALPCDALAQESFRFEGVRYRLFCNDGCLLEADSVDASSPAPRDFAERATRCDRLIAAVVEHMAPGKRAPYVPAQGDSIPPGRYPHLRERTWRVYFQLEQGWPMMSSGARIGMDASGRITWASVHYIDGTKLPRFHPKHEATLLVIARRAVPTPILGDVLEEGFWISSSDALDARSQLLFVTIFPVRRSDRPSAWQVTLDAETGRVIDSFTTDRNLVGEPPRAPREDRRKP